MSTRNREVRRVLEDGDVRRKMAVMSPEERRRMITEVTRSVETRGAAETRRRVHQGRTRLDDAQAGCVVTARNAEDNRIALALSAAAISAAFSGGSNSGVQSQDPSMNPFAIQDPKPW